jgi:hypothetical protein
MMRVRAKIEYDDVDDQWIAYLIGIAAWSGGGIGKTKEDAIDAMNRGIYPLSPYLYEEVEGYCK